MQSHIWKNDRDLLRATAISWGWIGYRNKSQHRRSTLEVNILELLLSGLEPANCRSRVQRSTTELLPPPKGVWDAVVKSSLPDVDISTSLLTVRHIGSARKRLQQWHRRKGLPKPGSEPLSPLAFREKGCCNFQRENQICNITFYNIFSFTSLCSCLCHCQ